MNNKDVLDNLLFQRNAIQLRYVELIDVQFNNVGIEAYSDLPFALYKHAEIENDYANIFLTAEIGSKEDTGFSMTIKYKIPSILNDQHRYRTIKKLCITKCSTYAFTVYTRSF